MSYHLGGNIWHVNCRPGEDVQILFQELLQLPLLSWPMNDLTFVVWFLFCPIWKFIVCFIGSGFKYFSLGPNCPRWHSLSAFTLLLGCLLILFPLAHWHLGNPITIIGWGIAVPWPNWPWYTHSCRSGEFYYYAIHNCRHATIFHEWSIDYCVVGRWLIHY